MTKTFSVGLYDNLRINYIHFKFTSQSDVDLFCDNMAIYIMEKYTNSLLSFIINKNYGYLSKTDMKNVYNKSKSLFSKICSKMFFGQKNIIKKSLHEYLYEENAGTIILEGFVRFRLGEYVQELEFWVDRAVDEFFIELEYKNYINLLREFLSEQKPKIRLVHIKQQDAKRYSVCDENFEELSQSRVFQLTGKTDTGIVCEEDLLLSNLINMAPKKIVIHNKEKITNKNFLQTINILFADKISLCAGCNWCGI